MNKNHGLYRTGLILALILSISGWIFAGEITISKGGSTIAYISEDGRIENSSRSTLGYVDSSGRVENAGRSTMGYIQDGRVENSGRSTIGYINSEGQVENAGRMTIGYITSGRVENASRSTVLTFSGSLDLTKIGAYIFFFNRVLKQK
jgi:hypothetical protein